MLKDYHRFEKPTVKGSFGPDVYTIKLCDLKATSDYFVTPLYKLEEVDGSYYEHNLRPALFEQPNLRRSMRKRRKRKS